MSFEQELNESPSHKVRIILEILDNKDLLPMIHNPVTKYAASRVETTTIMKYFSNGVNLYNNIDFKNKFREFSSYEPMTQWVLLISVSSDVEPNHKNIIRYRNRTMIVCSCTLESVIERGNRWPDPGLALEPKMITYVTAHINYRTGNAQLKVSLPTGMTLKETPYDYLRTVRKTMDPVIHSLRDLKQVTQQDVYSIEDGRTLMLQYIKEILTSINLMSPNAKPTRESLVAFLNFADDPNGYLHKGVMFPDYREYEIMMDIHNGNEEKVLRLQHDKPILERLLADHPTDPVARLREITASEIITERMPGFDTSLDFLIGLNEDEYDDVFNDRSKIEHYRKVVLDRWNLVHGNVNV